MSRHCTILLFCAVLLGVVVIVLVFADEPTAQPEITIQASSTLLHRQPESYGAANLMDENLITAWCEGKEDDGIGESITFTFREPRKVERIGIVVGYAKSSEVFRANNRVKAVTITLPDRELVKVGLKNEMEMQFIEIPPGAAASSLKIAINDVYRNWDNRSTCLSEIEVNPALTVSIGGLMWQRQAQSEGKTWDEAKIYCELLSLAGFRDWRLPSISELRSTIRGCAKTQTGGACGVTDDCCRLCFSFIDCWSCDLGGGPAYGCYWPNDFIGACSYFWSSSFDKDNTNAAAVVYFNFGRISHREKFKYASVRCARGGP
jgi:hypothetical protein